EQIELNEINGASAVNTITFESFTGNNNNVFLEYSASSSSNYTVFFNGADHITMKNMTIRALNASYSHVIEVEGGAEYNTLDNLILEGQPSTSTSTNRAVLYSSDDEDNYWTVKNCRFLNGSSAVYWEGSSTSSLESGTVFENNIAENFYYYGMRFAYQNAPYVKGNEIKSNTTYTSYGLYMYYCDNAMRVLGNSIFYNGSGSKYGLRLYYCDASTGAEGITANNFVTIDNGSSTAYGLYIYYADYQKVYFNTSYVNSTSSSGRAIYTYYGDDVQLSHNIGYNAGSGYAWYNYPSSGTNILASDYNVFYTNGTSLAYYSGGAVADLPALQAASGTDANSIEKNVYFADPANGDLHLVSPSEDDTDLHGMLLPEVTDDIDGDNRIVPFRGADEACYIVDGSIWFDFVNASGDPKPYVNVPGQIGVRYHVEFPEFDSDITITLNFYTVPGNSLVYTTQLYVQKQFGVTLDGYTMVNVDNIAEGFYRVEAVFNTKNSCGGYRDYIPADNSLLAMQNGADPCVVWPGDVNNDGIANYADKKALAGYIHDANLNPLWLRGPARYRADASVNPLTYLEWKPQASLPWSTPEGCYMDCDGNGVVNTFDNILFKKNWMRTHGAFQAKDEDVFSAATFDMSRNFPNPFNPSTTINYSVPERSHVQIIVTDMMGREVATLVNETVEAGVRSLTFDAANLPSGVYVATASMQGTETGLTFTKTIRMTLSK
ncbi:MAG: hypothetical protein CL946_02190, partial [Ectothiorhodospiraceae bacterium]|nr:hypothetical protein [Ectothiorhodospiraceae bacterium]